MKKILLGACLAGGIFSVHAQSVQQVGDVWYIELENHNWTQPAGEGVMTTSGANAGVTSGSGFAALYQNPAAPFLNSLISTNPAVNPALSAGTYVSYASDYHNVLATTNGALPSIHPSEPNYVWQEAGNNLGTANDNDPYAVSGPALGTIANYLATNTVHESGSNLTGLIQAAGISWKSYQEGIDMTPTSGTVNQPGASALTSVVAPTNQWTVPFSSFSGTSTNYTNPYNGSHQYNFAAKHDGTLFFTNTSGGTLTNANFSNSNPEVGHYAPMQQLQTDLSNNTVARDNLITPDQFNDMHTALSTAFTYNGVTWKSGSDGNRIAVGDNFLSIVVPEIMASAAFTNNGAIVIWTDETEGGTATSTNNTQNDYNHTLAEIVISNLAAGSTNGVGVFNDTNNYTHSDDIRTLQNLFGVADPNSTTGGYLNDASNAIGINPMFVAGSVPNSIGAVPEPSAYVLFGLGALVLIVVSRRRRA